MHNSPFLQSLLLSLLEVLRAHPNGLGPVQIQRLLGVDKDLSPTIEGMGRDGKIQRLAISLYIAGPKE